MNLFESTRRSGKIARLPRELRHKINHLLYHGLTAVRVGEWLNTLPVVQDLLKAEFAGRPISNQNLTEWKQGGYRDWLMHEQLLDQIGDRAAAASEIAHAAKDMSDSLFAILTLDYADTMKERQSLDPEDFEKKRESLCILSQDIIRLRRCHLHARRVEIQETRLGRDEEKTTEQLLVKFVEWTQNPKVRQALILAPLERMRRLREIYDLPPKPEDALVEKEIHGGKKAPDSGDTNPIPTSSNQKTKSRPAANQATAPETPPAAPSEIPPSNDETDSGRDGALRRPSPTSEIPSVSPSNEAASDVPSLSERGAHASRVPYSASPASLDTIPSASPEGCETLAGDNIPGHDPLVSSRPEGALENAAISTLSSKIPSPDPKPPLSHYERALAEGKTFLEALYAAQSPARNKPVLLVTGGALDSFSENAAHTRYRPMPEPPLYGPAPAPL